MAVVPQPVAQVPLGPRRRLWRDTSTALAVLGALVLVVLIVDPTRPGGAVLDAVGAPGSSSQVIGRRITLAGSARNRPDRRLLPRRPPRPPRECRPLRRPSARRPDGRSQPAGRDGPAPGHERSHGGPDALFGTTGLLRLRGPTGRQPEEHRQLVRDPVRTVLRLNPQVDDPRFVHCGGSDHAPDAATLAGARQRPEVLGEAQVLAVVDRDLDHATGRRRRARA